LSERSYSDNRFPQVTWLVRSAEVFPLGAEQAAPPPRDFCARDRISCAFRM